MKQLIKNWEFSKTAGTVTFSDFTDNLRLERIMLITDVTAGVIIYQFNSSSLGGTISDNVLTLVYDTDVSGFSDDDALQIIYDYAEERYEGQLTTNTTTTVSSATLYVSSISLLVTSAGTDSTLTVQDKQGTPLVLVDGLSTATAGILPTTLNFAQPIQMTGGIDIVTAGTDAATVNVWVSYID